jgi:hypothetical protein
VRDRRAFISGITFGLLAAPLTAGAQQVGRLVRVGVLSPGSSTEAREVQREPFCLSGPAAGPATRRWSGIGVSRIRRPPGPDRGE